MDLTKIAEQIQANAEKTIKRNDCDYIKDGLLHCGKCHTPKQCRVMISGREMKPLCICKCERERIEREDREMAEMKRQRKISDMQYRAFDSQPMRKLTFDIDDRKSPSVSDVCHNYVENFRQMDGKGLLFFGSVGTGKSFYAACIVNALLEKGVSCRFTTFTKQGKDPENLSEFELVVLDDLDAERDTEYMNEIVWSIIDERYQKNLPVIITTNLTAKQLSEAGNVFRQRIYSRLHKMCIFVEVKGTDRRKEAMRSDLSKYKNILGVK